MRILLDTNLLTRLINADDPDAQAVAEKSVDLLCGNAHVPVILPQNIYEFWAVATRPLEVNGLGMSAEEARTEIDDLLSLFPVLQDERAIFLRWLQLVSIYEVTGKPAHDTRLVAAMLRHDIDHILTFNAKDFLRYKEITVWTPEMVTAGASSR